MTQHANDEKHTPKPATGVIFLDWDNTIVTYDEKAKIPEIIGGEKTAKALKHALQLGMHIHIVTARVDIEEAYDLIFADLKTLGLLDTLRDKEFWRKHIHCVVKNMDEKVFFDNNKNQRNAEIAKRKAERICKLADEQYSHLEKRFRNFYDDEKANCDKVREGKKVTAVEADMFTKVHINLMEKVNNQIQNNLKTIEARQALLKNLNDCLSAIYPQRNAWSNDLSRIKAAGGAKQIHELCTAKMTELSFEQIDKLREIAGMRLAKYGCACLPAFFGGRKAPLQKLYEILVELKQDITTHLIANEKINLANQELEKLLASLQPKIAPARAQPLPHRTILAATK